MNYGIIKIGSALFLNSDYYKILQLLKNENIKIVSGRIHSEKDATLNFGYSSISFQYLVFIVKGEKIDIKLKKVRKFCQEIFKNSNNQVYVSNQKTFENDIKTYFDLDALKILNFEVERTLAIIKPDAYKNREEIKEILRANGLRIIQEKEETLDEEILKKHYSHLIDKPFYNNLEKYMMSGPVDIMVLEGIDAVKKLRNIMGPTNSKEAPKETIRGIYGTDITHNAIHGSDSKENAEIEIERFFKNKEKVIKKV